MSRPSRKASFQAGLSVSLFHLRQVAYFRVSFGCVSPDYRNSNSAQIQLQIQPHILVAEDDADTRELVKLILGQAGFRVSITGDPAEVMPLLFTARFDAVLLDNWMPKINGIELCRLIRSHDQKLPIFFCSGAVTEGDKQAAFDAGAQGYFGKPFDKDELTTTLRAAVNIQPT